MKLEQQGAKPSGFIGKIIGRLMNKVHTELYANYFSDNMPANNSNILDIGCGGGKFIKFLSKTNNSYTLYGLDHSSEMVGLSKKVNAQAITENRVSITQGLATDIPIDSKQIDLVTAFETIMFWSDITKSFSEILRLLKNDGLFLIINRYPPKNSKWWKIAKIKNDKEYISKLKGIGFKSVNVDLNYKKGWIIVNAIK